MKMRIIIQFKLITKYKFQLPNPSSINKTPRITAIENKMQLNPQMAGIATAPQVQMGPTSIQQCAICQQQPEDLLVLVCGHNLCVSCATEVYNINGNGQTFICEICLMETQLDAETVQCFNSTTQRIQAISEINIKQVHKPPKCRSPKNCPPSPAICKTHNQQILYICTQCLSIDLCSQCILSPTNRHSSHMAKVLTIKKGFQNMEKKMQEQILQLNNAKKRLREQREAIRNIKQDMGKDMNKKKQYVKGVFDSIARSISQRYSELCQDIQRCYKKSQKILQAYSGQVSQKQQALDRCLSIYEHSTLNNNNDPKLLLQIMNSTSSIVNTKQLYSINIPNIKQLPSCSLTVANGSGDVETVLGEIAMIINRIMVRQHSQYIGNQQSIIYSHGIQTQHKQQQEIDYSLIHPNQPYSHIQHMDNGKTVLKQSRKGSMNGSRNNNTNANVNVSRNMSKMDGNLNGSKMSNSRKLDLSRSLENATYIINRLQQRAKIADN